ncbi:unnamed protein product [Aureobasidium pullulans]|nr:unnamed protein product [Aureobasidium pullulans]
MKFLNAGSTAEGSSTKQTRFVCFDLIPEQWTQESAEGCVLNRALEYTGLIGLVDTAVGSPSEVPGFTLFETVLTTVAFNFISHHEYFGADHTKVAPCLICPPRWSVRIAVSPLTTARLSRALVQTGLIGLLDLMASPSNGSQPSTPPAEHNPWTFGSAMNAADFGECFDYDIFIRYAMLVAEVIGNWNSGSIELPFKNSRAVFLFEFVTRNAILDTEVVGNRSSEYLDFRSTEFRALSLFVSVTGIAVLDGEGVKNGEGSIFESGRENTN